jgi:ketosteroid isomerase-like protein
MMLAAVLLMSLVFAQAKLDPDECAVWQRELSFAQSVDNHDAKAFAAYLHPGTVFAAGTENPGRGADAVLKSWAALIEGRPLRLRWRPNIVNIGGNRNVAISRGPYMIEDTRPDAKPQYRVGTFTTIWGRKSADAPWLVLFDGGGDGVTPMDDLAAAEKFMARAPASCPGR